MIPTETPPLPSTDPRVKMSDIEMSATCAKLFGALGRAQAMFRNAPKNAVNEDCKSRYADLAASLDACRDALTSNGLAVMQFPTTTGRQVHVRTLLAHESGEWISSKLSLMALNEGPHAICSAITYMRRYGFQSTVGLAGEGEDDDGQGAAGRGKSPGPVPQPQPGESKAPPAQESVVQEHAPVETTDWIKRVAATISERELDAVRADLAVAQKLGTAPKGAAGLALRKAIEGHRADLRRKEKNRARAADDR